MTYFFTNPNTQKRNQNSLLFFATCAVLLIASVSLHAQNTLVGLTSNGGAEGRGTAFTINTSGTGFSVIKGFADWGKNPNGDLYKNSDGNFYGMTSLGGTYTQGTIFRMTPAGAVTILRHLNSPVDGGSPHGELIKGKDGNFYGLTSAGGTNTYGTIFKMSPDGSTYTVLKHFNYAADGTNPRGHLVQAADGNFYGITVGGGAKGFGTIFKITPGGAYTVLRHMDKVPDGSNSYGSLTLGKDGKLYGITNSGGTYGYGTIFRITTGAAFTVLKHLNGPADGGYSQSDLIQGTDGNFYGTCYGYGQKGNGTIFKMTPTGGYTVLRHLSSGNDGGYPYGNLYQNNDGFLYGMNRTGGTGGAGTAYKISTTGASYTVLHSFITETEGNTPNGGFVKGNDGNLYAMISLGGPFTGGTIIKMTTTGTTTTLVKLNGAAQGNAPMETLIKGKDSAYYGTTSGGGTYGHGTIFKICGGKTTVLKSFNKNIDGGVPLGSLKLATDGNFYGTTSEGGTNGGYGTIFKITPGGAYSVLRHLSSSTDGGSPYGSLIQATDGFLYGMNRNGGTNAGGTIFRIATTGAAASFKVLRHLKYADDGSNPEGSLVQGTDGNFYGMTSSNAKIFKITPTGTFTVLRSLVSGSDGSFPLGSLVQAADGKLWGTTSSGGTHGFGTVFNVTTTGTFKTMKHFNSTPDGKTPKGSLVIVQGVFYGMTSSGGTYNAGTIFKLTSTGTFTVLRHLNLTTDGGNPFGGFVLAPVSNFIADAKTVNVNEDASVQITLSGSGGSPLAYTVVKNPEHGKLSGTAPNLTYKPDKNYYGPDKFTYIVGIGCITSPFANVNITVKPMPDSPVLAPIGNKTVIKDSTLKFTAKATDVDSGQVIKYSLIGAPAGATINANTGAFSWKPSATGSYTFKVRATDNGTPALYDEEQIKVTVTTSLAGIVAEDDLSVQQQIKMKVNILPNPATDVLHISLRSPASNLSVRVLDQKGTVISSYKFGDNAKTNYDVDVSELKSGIYMLELQSDNLKEALKFIKN